MLRTLPVLQSLARLLEPRGIPYFVHGGRAAKEYGLSRCPQDVDVSIGLEPTELGLARRWVQLMGWRVLDRDPWVLQGRAPHVWSFDPESHVKVDVALTFMQFQRNAMQRARRVMIGSLPVRFATVEDVIVLKICGWRAQDIADVRELMNRSPQLDRARVREGLQEVGRDLSRSFINRWETFLREISLRPLDGRRAL